MAQDTDKRHNSNQRHDVCHILRLNRHSDTESAPGASILAKDFASCSFLGDGPCEAHQYHFRKGVTDLAENTE